MAGEVPTTATTTVQAAPVAYGAPAVTYGAAPAVTYGAAPAVTYGAAAPATYAAARPVTYGAVPGAMTYGAPVAYGAPAAYATVTGVDMNQNGIPDVLEQ